MENKSVKLDKDTFLQVEVEVFALYPFESRLFLKAKLSQMRLDFKFKCCFTINLEIKFQAYKYVILQC